MKRLLQTILAVVLTTTSFIVYAAPLTFGVASMQYEPLAKTSNIRGYQNFVKSLSNQLKTPVKLMTFSNSTSLMNAVKAGKVDLAYMNVVTFIKAQSNNNSIQPLATVLASNQNGQKTNSYPIAIVTLAKNTKINSTSDLNNAKFAFARNSLSGFYAPSYYLQNRNISYSYHFYNNQYDALRALKKNEVNAAVVWNPNFQLKKDRVQLKQIQVIGNVPNPVIVASSKLPTSQASAVKIALMKLPASAYKGLNFSGVQSYNSSMYNTAFNAVQNVKGPSA